LLLDDLNFFNMKGKLLNKKNIKILI
jgi:hypothetical protein